MGQLALLFAALPMAGGPVAAAVLVLRRRPGAPPSRASRRFADELRAVADLLPRLHALPRPVHRPPGPGSFIGYPGHARVPEPRRPREPQREPACAHCAR